MEATEIKKWRGRGADFRGGALRRRFMSHADFSVHRREKVNSGRDKNLQRFRRGGCLIDRQRRQNRWIRAVGGEGRGGSTEGGEGRGDGEAGCNTEEKHCCWEIQDLLSKDRSVGRKSLRRRIGGLELEKGAGKADSAVNTLAGALRLTDYEGERFASYPSGKVAVGRCKVEDRRRHEEGVTRFNW